MTRTMFVIFAKTLEKYSVHSFHKGPLFHRWLPNGEANAIVINDKENKAIVEIWFERYGFVNDRFIQFSYERKEVDPAIMARQAVLDAGPIHGRITLEVSKDELEAVQKNRKGDSAYEAVGKRLVKKIIPSKVIRFLRILKITYGQHWIDVPDYWNSQFESLGGYCQSWQMEWSIDGKNWSKFLPNQPLSIINLEIGGSSWTELIHQDDWTKLAELMQSDYDPPLAGVLVSYAHELYDQGKWRQAFIEGVSALEIAIKEFYRREDCGDKEIQDALKAFWNLPLKTQLAIALFRCGKAQQSNITDAQKAIGIRNDVVHKGYEPTEADKDVFPALLCAINALLPDPSFRFPTNYIGNELRKSVEDWSKE